LFNNKVSQEKKRRRKEMKKITRTLAVTLATVCRIDGFVESQIVSEEMPVIEFVGSKPKEKEILKTANTLYGVGNYIVKEMKVEEKIYSMDLDTFIKNSVCLTDSISNSLSE
jgi:hypothetical protein